MYDIHQNQTLPYKVAATVQNIKEAGNNYSRKIHIKTINTLYTMPLVIHRYLKKLKTNPQAPGLADFLRGTITLFQYAKKYNYTLKIDLNSHPIFELFDIPEELTCRIDPSEDTIEVVCPLDYRAMPEILDTLFRNGKNINILTHAYYSELPIMIDEYKYIKSILTPNTKLKNLITTIKEKSNIDFSKPYITIHIRTGDESLVYNDHESATTLNTVKAITNYIAMNNPIKQVLVITDSKEVKSELKTIYTTINCNPVHTGSLNTINLITDLYSTMAEFSLMSQSSEIHCITRWVYSSGFSKLCSKIYGIPYSIYGLQ